MSPTTGHWSLLRHHQVAEDGEEEQGKKDEAEDLGEEANEEAKEGKEEAERHLLDHNSNWFSSHVQAQTIPKDGEDGDGDGENLIEKISKMSKRFHIS